MLFALDEKTNAFKLHSQNYLSLAFLPKAAAKDFLLLPHSFSTLQTSSLQVALVVFCLYVPEKFCKQKINFYNYERQNKNIS